MARTTIASPQLLDGGITRADLNTTTTTSAVVAKLIQGTGMSLSSSGVDAGTGDVTINASATGILDILSTTRGTILYRNATVWVALAPGTAGQVLQSGGAGADPSWVSMAAFSQETSSIYDGATALTPKFAIIDHAGSGDNTIVAAVASKKIRVHQAFLVASGTVTARFESGAGGTAKSGQMNLVANTGFVLPFSPMGWFETASNTLLNLELSAAVSCDGMVGYTEV